MLWKKREWGRDDRVLKRMTLTKEQKPLCVFVCGSVCMVCNDGVMGRGSVQDQKGVTAAPVHTRAVLSPSLALSFFMSHTHITRFLFLNTFPLLLCPSVFLSKSASLPYARLLEKKKKKSLTLVLLSMFQMMLLKLYVNIISVSPSLFL